MNELNKFIKNHPAFIKVLRISGLVNQHGYPTMKGYDSELFIYKNFEIWVNMDELEFICKYNDRATMKAYMRISVDKLFERNIWKMD